MCVEMEGAAVGHVAAANKIPFVVIRSMSDGADDNAGMSFDEFAPKAAEHSAKIVMEMLKLA
jgi:adenosylhomocysteine nucleosidase